MGRRAANRADALVDGVVGRGHVIDGAGLGLAVGYEHILHVHFAYHPLHDLHRAGGTRHDPGAQTAEIVVVEIGEVEFGNEHGGDAMQCRTALLRHSRQRRRRVKGLARKYRGRTVGDARQVTHHHAEAVVQGHRNAQSVVLRQAHAIADELAVVEDIEMGESGHPWGCR